MLKGAMVRAPSSTLGLMLLVIVLQAADILPGNIPQQLQAVVEARTFKASFDIGTWLNPFYLRGDFDGDGVPDYALLVTLRSDGRKGIAVWLSTKHQSRPTIIGAGKKSRVASGDSDDWSFFDAWQVYSKRIVPRRGEGDKPPKLSGDAILIEKTEAASGLLYWDGNQFRWYQLGD